MHADGEQGTAPIETREESFGSSEQQAVAYWLTELELADKNEKTWREQGKEINKKYRGEAGDGVNARMNILYSNVTTLQPALFQKMPRPIVERRFKQKDSLSRLVAEVMERALGFIVDDTDMEHEVKAARDDYLLPGRGLLKLDYNAEINDPSEGMDDEQLAAALAAGASPQDILPQIVMQDARMLHVAWDDIRLPADGRWSKKRWVGFRTRMNRSELVERFGDKGQKVKVTKLPVDLQEREDNKYQVAMFKTAEVWEIWDRKSGKVVWISDGCKDCPLDEVDDPYRLRKFFPCPRPLQVIETSTDPTPVPEYKLYEDQAAEVNRLTRRIYSLSDKIRAVGAYAGDMKAEMRSMLSQADGTLIPIENWMAVAESGGLKGKIEWAPIREMIEVLSGLYQARASAKEDLYEVSGISDIVRGQGESGETATAQRIKGQFATLRLDERKRLVSQFIAEALQILGEFLAEHFEPHILAAMTDIDLPMDDMEKQAKAQEVMFAAAQQGDPQAMQQAQAQAKKIMEGHTWEQVVQVLRDDYARAFAIRIETEDTIEVDRQADKQARIEFLTAFVQLLNAFAPLVQGGIMPFEVAKEVLLFSVRGFSKARELEDVLEDLAPPAPPPGENEDEGDKIKLAIEELRGKFKLLEQAKDHQFEAVEGDKDRMLKVADLQVRAVEGGARIADQQQARHEQREDKAMDRGDQLARDEAERGERSIDRAHSAVKDVADRSERDRDRKAVAQKQGAEQ